MISPCASVSNSIGSIPMAFEMPKNSERYMSVLLRCLLTVARSSFIASDISRCETRSSSAWTFSFLIALAGTLLLFVNIVICCHSLTIYSTRRVAIWKQCD